MLTKQSKLAIDGSLLTEEPEEYTLEDFYNYIKNKSEGIELEVIGFKKLYTSKWKTREQKERKTLEIIFKFKVNDSAKKVVIPFNLGNEISEDTFFIGSKFLLFNFLNLKLKLKFTNGTKLTSKQIKELLLGLKFIGKAEAYNGTHSNFYVLKPVRLIDGSVKEWRKIKRKNLKLKL